MSQLHIFLGVLIPNMQAILWRLMPHHLDCYKINAPSDCHTNSTLVPTFTYLLMRIFNVNSMLVFSFKTIEKWGQDQFVLISRIYSIYFIFKRWNSPPAKNFRKSCMGERSPTYTSLSTIVMADVLDSFNVRQKYTYFQILVIDQANAGKTTLLKQVCNTTDDPHIYNEGKNLVHFFIQFSKRHCSHIPWQTSWSWPQRWLARLAH